MHKTENGEVEELVDEIEENEEIENIEETEENMEDKNLDMYEEKVKENAELNTQYLRLQADFANYKKRMEKEKENIYAYSNQDIMKELILVLDNFERALDSEKAEEKSGFHQGIEMVYSQLIDILKKNNLEEIEAIGEKFDPNVHHGVAQEESEDYDEETVIDVFQKGYKLKDRVIRPSMVKISK